MQGWKVSFFFNINRIGDAAGEYDFFINLFFNDLSRYYLRNFSFFVKLLYIGLNDSILFDRSFISWFYVWYLNRMMLDFSSSKRCDHLLYSEDISGGVCWFFLFLIFITGFLVFVGWIGFLLIFFFKVFLINIRLFFLSVVKYCWFIG